MSLKIHGTGFINSQITKSKYLNETNEEINICRFQIASFKKFDKKKKKKVYSHFLCQSIGKMADIIGNNFIKGQKIYIEGDLNEDTIKNKNYKYDNSLNEKENNKRAFINIISITITHIEFMANNKDEKYEKQNDDKEIEEVLNNYISEKTEEDEETFI